MNETKFLSVVKQIRQGAYFQLGRNAAGREKLKFYSGPFRLMVQRFELNESQSERLRELMRDRKKTEKSNTPISNPVENMKVFRAENARR